MLDIVRVEMEDGVDLLAIADHGIIVDSNSWAY